MCPRRIVESEEKVTLEETKEETSEQKRDLQISRHCQLLLLPREQERGYPKSKHRPKIRRKVLSCSKEWESERKPNE